MCAFPPPSTKPLQAEIIPLWLFILVSEVQCVLSYLYGCFIYGCMVEKNSVTETNKRNKQTELPKNPNEQR